MDGISCCYMTENYMLRYRLIHNNSYNDDSAFFSMRTVQPLLVAGFRLTATGTGSHPAAKQNCTTGKSQQLKPVGLAT